MLLLIVVFFPILSRVLVLGPRARQQEPFKAVTQDEDKTRVPITVLPALTASLLSLPFLLRLLSHALGQHSTDTSRRDAAAVRSFF